MKMHKCFDKPPPQNPKGINSFPDVPWKNASRWVAFASPRFVETITTESTENTELSILLRLCSADFFVHGSHGKHGRRKNDGATFSKGIEEEEEEDKNGI